MVEIGRVDIFCQVFMMSSYLAFPHEGHLKELFHIFAYLKKYHHDHHSEMVFDPRDPVVNERQFEEKYWTASEFGSHNEEELPENTPMPRVFGACYERLR